MGVYDKKLDVKFPVDPKKVLGAVIIIVALVVISWIVLFTVDLFKPMALSAVLSKNPLSEGDESTVLDLVLLNVTGEIAKNVEVTVQAEDYTSILVDADEFSTKKVDVLEAGAFKKLQFDVRKNPVKKVLPGSYKINIRTEINGQEFTRSVFLVLQ